MKIKISTGKNETPNCNINDVHHELKRIFNGISFFHVIDGRTIEFESFANYKFLAFFTLVAGFFTENQCTGYLGFGKIHGPTRGCGKISLDTPEVISRFHSFLRDIDNINSIQLDIE